MLPSNLQLIIWALFLALSLAWEKLKLPWFALLIPLALWLIALIISAKNWQKRAEKITISRQSKTAIALGDTLTMHLTIKSQNKIPLEIECYDSHTPHLESENKPLKLKLQAQQSANLSYPLKACQRGKYQFNHLELRLQHKNSLWIKEHKISLPQQGYIHPRIYKSLPLCYPQKNQIRPTRYRQQIGQGEFNHLRDYQINDPIKHIDHKASARLNKAMSKIYSTEYEQPLILLIDSSVRTQGLFDDILSAVLTLSHEALKYDNQLTLKFFASAQQQETHQLTRRNKRYNSLIKTLSQKQNYPYPPDYYNTCKTLYQTQKSRALIILLSILQAEDQEALHKSITLLKKRHDLAIISIIPPYLNTQIKIDDETAFETMGARDLYHSEYHNTLKKLQKENITLIKTLPQEISYKLLQFYRTQRKSP